MDTRTASIYMFAIRKLLEQGHKFTLTCSHVYEDSSNSGSLAGIGASEYHKKKDTLVLRAKIPTRKDGYNTDMVIIDDFEPSDDEDQEQEEQDE